MKQCINYKAGEPCFQNDTPRYIKAYIDDERYKIFYGVCYVQGMIEKQYDHSADIDEMINESILEVFKQYKTKLNKQDRLFFKFYFEQL